MINESRLTLDRRVNRVPGQVQKERLAFQSVNEAQRLIGQTVCEIIAGPSSQIRDVPIVSRDLTSVRIEETGRCPLKCEKDRV